MNPMLINFIASDMDGTLLDSTGKLNPEFFDIFNQLREKKILFAAASGRQYFSLKETFKKAQDDIIYIAENGTFVVYKNEEIYSCTICAISAQGIIRQARQIEGAYTVLCGKKSAYIETNDEMAVSEIKKYYHRLQFVEDLTQVNDEFLKIAICHFSSAEKSVYQTLSAILEGKEQVVLSAKIWVDIMNLKASKGNAIRYLQHLFHFSFETSMSFGDYLNDLEMLKSTYHSYAMDNAHPKVKEIARFVAPSNEESGVLTIIKKEILDT